ncbi:MAG: ankyrin repeat domain-containing protein [Deltaproteobacteria bacterium]|nr:ankyrin repeat domain-containing protein [Deltaproteobacteria bacterium]
MKRILFSMVCILLAPVIFAEASISDQNSQLIRAAEKGNLSDKLVALVNHTGIKSKNISYGLTALMIASQAGQMDIVKLLLDRGADVNEKTTTTGTTALYLASQNGHTEVVKLLLDKGADSKCKENHYRYDCPLGGITERLCRDR